MRERNQMISFCQVGQALLEVNFAGEPDDSDRGRAFAGFSRLVPEPGFVDHGMAHSGGKPAVDRSRHRLLEFILGMDYKYAELDGYPEMAGRPGTRLDHARNSGNCPSDPVHTSCFCYCGGYDCLVLNARVGPPGGRP